MEQANHSGLRHIVSRSHISRDIELLDRGIYGGVERDGTGVVPKARG
jgi:hypothetical protein